MTEEISTTSHLSVAMTTQEIDQTQTTGRSGVTSSSAMGDDFYWAVPVLFMGIVGTAGNALILYALVASKQHKKHIQIVNQNALDLFSSFFLIVRVVTTLCSFHLTGVSGYWLCFFILSDNVAYWGANGSMVNLATITIDRYLKVVYPIWSRKYLRRWVVYSAMAFAWLAAILFNTIIAGLTVKVFDGMCRSYVFDSHNIMSSLAPAVFYCTYFYVDIIVIFIFCYWRILVAIRRQARVMASHSTAGSSTSQTQSQQIQTTVIKTMVLVSAFYAIAWLPMTLYALLTATQLDPMLYSSGSFYDVSSFIAFFYTSANPFIYATKFDPVRQILRKMIPCKKTAVQPTDFPLETTGSRTGDKRAVQVRK